MSIIYILLAIIAYFLYRIYRQKEDEKEAVANEKSDAEYEQRRKEKFKDYPHIFNKVDDNWIQVFAHHGETPGHLLKMMFYLMLGESTRIDYSEGSVKWDTLWDCSNELLEHLEKYHEGSSTEHEIAICAYWQVAAEEMGKLIEENPNTGSLSSGKHTSEVAGAKLEASPFTDINKIAGWFPKKANHPAHEISFFNKDGSFPRKSTGSNHIDERMRAIGL
jgi:hypothetical protein